MATPTKKIVASEEEKEQALRDYKVTIEYKHLKAHAPGGVYLVPAYDSLRFFYGVIFVRRGPYINGIFKFQLILPPQYNGVNQHPQIVFTSNVYNPHVEESGRLDVESQYPEWDPSKHYLVTVLTFLKKIFYAKNFDDAKANPEAKELAVRDPTAYREKIDQCVRDSQKLVYQNDQVTASVRFTEEQLVHQVLRDLLKNNIKEPEKVTKQHLLSMIEKASKV